MITTIRTTREKFIDRMLESSEEKERIRRPAKELGIKTRTARRWGERYQETNEMPYNQSEKNTDRKSSFPFEHKEYIRKST